MSLFSPGKFANYMEEYRKGNQKHQNEAFRAATKNKKGIIVSPTGTGKTRMQAQVVLQCFSQNNPAIAVVSCHRLALSSQHTKDFCVEMHKSELPFNVVFIGTHNKSDIREKINKIYSDRSASQRPDMWFSPSLNDLGLDSTRKEQVQNDLILFASNTRNNKRNLLIFTTFHSIAILNIIEKIDVHCCDEAHNLTESEHYKRYFTSQSTSMKSVSSICEREYFYTATPFISGDTNDNTSFAMNNEKAYGKVIFNLLPKDAIEDFLITRPLIVECYEDSYNSDRSCLEPLFMLIKQTFYKADMLLNKSSKNGGKKIYPQGILKFRTRKEVERIYKYLPFIKWAKQEGIKIFATTSKTTEDGVVSGGNFVGAEEVGREDFLTHLQNVTDQEKLLIFQIDILTTGIDLPSLNFCLPLAQCSLARLIQFVGRVLRLDSDDRKDRFSNKVINRNLKNKPFGLVFLPTFLLGEETTTSMVSDLCTAYDGCLKYYKEVKDTTNTQPSVSSDIYSISETSALDFGKSKISIQFRLPNIIEEKMCKEKIRKENEEMLATYEKMKLLVQKKCIQI